MALYDLLIQCMKVVDFNKINTAQYGCLIDNVQLYTMCVQIKRDELNIIALKMLEMITDISWIKALGVIDQIAYRARALPSVEKLSQSITSGYEDSKLSSDFGEYLVSINAQRALQTTCEHNIVPLAELWKEKKSGNPGFDFHTESSSMLLIFGEAKYSSGQSPYQRAISQVEHFMILKKDDMELADLQRFVSDLSVRNAADGKRGYCVAFSIINESYEEVIRKTIESLCVSSLIHAHEVYAVAIKII